MPAAKDPTLYFCEGYFEETLSTMVGSAKMSPAGIHRPKMAYPAIINGIIGTLDPNRDEGPTRSSEAQDANMAIMITYRLLKYLATLSRMTLEGMYAAGRIMKNQPILIWSKPSCSSYFASTGSI